MTLNRVFLKHGHLTGGISTGQGMPKAKSESQALPAVSNQTNDT